MDQVIQIVTTTTCQLREPPEEQRGMIERALKLGAKTYDSTGDPEAAYLWLDRVSEIYAVMGCSNEQKVLFSGFLIAARAKDWWEAIKRRHPTGITWDQFRQAFTDRFYSHSYKDSTKRHLGNLLLHNIPAPLRNNFIHFMILFQNNKMINKGKNRPIKPKENEPIILAPLSELSPIFSPHFSFSIFSLHSQLSRIMRFNKHWD